MLHIDILSRIISLFFKIVSTVIILLTILTLSEPYADQKIVLKKGKGAQIGLVLDRSASMDDPFAGGDDNKSIAETKSAAASRLIVDFFNSRTDDMVGVITFSNSAMFILPLTNNKEAIRAAVSATAGNALFQTNIGAGLSSSAELFTSIENSGSRAVILLSDGAGRIYLGTSNSGIEYSQNKKNKTKNNISIHPLAIHFKNPVNLFLDDAIFVKYLLNFMYILEKFI